TSLISLKAQSVTILAEATGGDAGYIGSTGILGGDGGTAMATAFGRSTKGTVDVTAIQTSGHGGYSLISGQGGDGADSFMKNAVRGRTKGELTLIQTAVAGSAGSSPKGDAGEAGDAKSLLTLHNSAASTLSGTVSATGGNGGIGLHDTTDGGSASAHIDLSAL